MARAIRLIVVHHNGVDGRTWRDIERTHKSPPNNYKAIGYHRVIHEDGSVHAGRPETMHGAHTKKGARNMNAISLGVCLIGNLNVRTMYAAQYAALLDTLVDWCARYGLPESAVIGHRETPAHGGAPTKKQCPGKLIDMNALRAAVAKRLEKKS